MPLHFRTKRVTLLSYARIEVSILMNKQRFVVIDVETTGNSPKKGDKIIQIAAVVIENGQITERFSKYINPNKSIPAFIE